MKMKYGLMAGLLASAASSGLEARRGPASAPPASPAQATTTPVTTGSPAETVPSAQGVAPQSGLYGVDGQPLSPETLRLLENNFESLRDANGEPLSPELLRSLKEAFKKNSATNPESAGSSPAQATTTPVTTDSPAETVPSAQGVAPQSGLYGVDGQPLSPETLRLLENNFETLRDADGQPLPPEIQRALKEEFKRNSATKPEPAASPADVAGGGDIVVTGQARGAVIGDIPPERSFNPLDIRAFGADNIGALIETIGSQVTSNRGGENNGPITLLNGKRISDFSEIARIPSEAIERMDVFPEELALKYGYRADQKVVNVVTFARWRSHTGQVTYVAPTEGGRNTGSASADYFAIRGDTRINLGATLGRSDALLESDRNVRQFNGVPELGRFRTLVPKTNQVGLNGLVSGRVLNNVSATLNGRFDTSQSESLLGLDDEGPLRRNTDRNIMHLGTTLGGRSGRLMWTVTGNYDRTSTKFLTDVANAAAKRDEARSVETVANADILLTGPIVELPAGPFSASFRGGVEFQDLASRSSLGGVEDQSRLARDRGTGQLNLDLPLLSRDPEEPSRLGKLSANANFGLEKLSDAGVLRTFGYGLNWSPVEAVSFNASAVHEQSAPTLQQLGGPLLLTPNVRVFDFAEGEVADITWISGGNPGLRSDDRHVVTLGVNAQPLAQADLTVSLDYVATRTENPIATFPILTPQIEVAFPDRFTRGGDGRLVRIDGRSLNFARSKQGQLRWGVNFTRPLGSVPSGMSTTKMRVFADEAAYRRAYPGAVIVPMDTRTAENLMSRLSFSLYHNWYLKDAVVLREGHPSLDLLDGGAVDFRGGRRRHEVEFQAGAFKNGLGARFTANWQSGTEIGGLGGTASGLRFGGLATMNLNLFVNFSDRMGGRSAPKWSHGTRATIGVANVFNARPQVRDLSGATPLSYQPAYFDPIGRTINFNLRKIF